jgi:hypothetical protein
VKVNDFNVWIAKQISVSPEEAKRYVLHMSVGMGFGVVAAIIGEHMVATILFLAVPATLLLKVWLDRRRDFESRLDARLKYTNTDIKAVIAPFETLINQYNGVIVAAHSYGSAGPIVVFRAPFAIAQWLHLIVSSTGLGRTDITYIWGLSARFDAHCPDRFVWRLEANDRRFDISGEHFAFDSVKFAADFEVIAAELAKLIEAANADTALATLAQ